ncbi:MAG: glutamine-hydrolyzing carbamoyl-phosphate synthase small subunit [Alphaproteobacteria bacterium]
MASAQNTLPPGTTGVLVLADGTVLAGLGCGAIGSRVGEACFNTAMTGYQEILTDPSYMAQIVAFTFPHIGNVGTNSLDLEQISGASDTAARGAIFRDAPTPPANYRSEADFDEWMKRRDVVGLYGVDTRALTLAIREGGMPHAVIAHSPDGLFDLEALKAQARSWSGIVGLDLAKDATCLQPFDWSEGLWSWEEGYAPLTDPRFNVVVLDYGVKRNILRGLTSIGARVTVVPASTSAEAILARKPDGVLLSNGPGDPAATGEYAVPEIQKLVESGTPVFGICLGHQMLALALGAETVKMEQGHHGANHPVKDLTTGKVEIVSMNHGFTVDRATLPEAVMETHISLFDGTNAGIALKNRPVFSVQHHPEASPGPTDSLYVFERFADLMRKA